MSASAQADLIHKVNNLLTVIYTQVEVGRTEDSLKGARDALEEIRRAAESTMPFVRALRQQAGKEHEA